MILEALSCAIIFLFDLVVYGVFSRLCNSETKIQSQHNLQSFGCVTCRKTSERIQLPDVTSPRDEDEVMAALNLSEGVTEKFDLILAKLCSLDSKMEDLNTTVKSLIIIIITIIIIIIC